MAIKHVDPELAVHPLRLELDEDDWERIRQAVFDDHADAVTEQEIEAMQDVLFDAIAGKLQTHQGVTTLQ